MKSERMRVRLIGCLCAAALMPAACRKSEKAAEPTEENVAANTPKEASKVTVAYLYGGPKEDFGFNQAIATAAAAVSRLPGVRVVEQEGVADREGLLKAIDKQVLDGAKVLFASQWDYFAPYLVEKAPHHHRTQFMHLGGLYLEGRHPENVGSYLGFIEEPMYVAGVVAGLSTKKNVLGFVIARPASPAMRAMNAFTLGARWANPAVKVRAIFTGEWSATQAETAAANKLIDEGADVLAMYVDSPKAIIEIAEQRGVMVSGIHFNASSLASRGWLTGAEWNWAKIHTDFVTTVRDGLPPPVRMVRGGFKEGYVQMSPFGPAVTEEVRRKADQVRVQLLEGHRQVFRGPLKDNQGRIRVEDGSTLLPRDVKIEMMDWMVEGIEGQLPD